MHKQRALAAVEWKVNELLFSRPAPKVIVPRGGGRGEEGWGRGGGGKTTSFPLPNDSPKNSHPKIVNISQNVWSSSNGRLFDQMLYRKRRQQQKSYESWKVTRTHTCLSGFVSICPFVSGVRISSSWWKLAMYFFRVFPTQILQEPAQRNLSTRTDSSQTVFKSNDLRVLMWQPCAESRWDSTCFHMQRRSLSQKESSDGGK